MCLNASGVFFTLNMHVEMGKTIGKSMRSKHLGISTFRGGFFASPWGRTHFRQKSFKKLTSNKITARAAYCFKCQGTHMIASNTKISQVPDN